MHLFKNCVNLYWSNWPPLGKLPRKTPALLGLTNLSKAFVFLDHKLLSTKLNAYILSHREQRKKIDNTFSTWKLYLDFDTVQYWEHCYSVLMADLFLIIRNIDIINYADDNTLYIVGVIRNVFQFTALGPTINIHITYFTNS